jgi:hypothetical protein
LQKKSAPSTLVNCDREPEVGTFWNAYDERKREHFQFYFVAACPTQMPPSFCERMIFEMIVEELDEREDAILCFRKPDSERMSHLQTSPGYNLEKSQKQFRAFFSQTLPVSRRSQF